MRIKRGVVGGWVCVTALFGAWVGCSPRTDIGVGPGRGSGGEGSSLSQAGSGGGTAPEGEGGSPGDPGRFLARACLPFFPGTFVLRHFRRRQLDRVSVLRRSLAAACRRALLRSEPSFPSGRRRRGRVFWPTSLAASTRVTPSIQFEQSACSEAACRAWTRGRLAASRPWRACGFNTATT